MKIFVIILLTTISLLGQTRKPNLFRPSKAKLKLYQEVNIARRNPEKYFFDKKLPLTYCIEPSLDSLIPDYYVDQEAQKRAEYFMNKNDNGLHPVDHETFSEYFKDEIEMFQYYNSYGDTTSLMTRLIHDADMENPYVPFPGLPSFLHRDHLLSHIDYNLSDNIPHLKYQKIGIGYAVHKNGKKYMCVILVPNNYVLSSSK